ncbi:uncharacterized protein LOC134437298 [Engraulis encrasicolus]|uniref:uncharacterized protein LOC134437298 n=1 Tax=Engraulis encrasicolus TaxID=184585 RepID=UPI002FCFE28D
MTRRCLIFHWTIDSPLCLHQPWAERMAGSSRSKASWKMLSLLSLACLIFCGHATDPASARLLILPETSDLSTNTEGLMLQCVVEPDKDWKYLWYKNHNSSRPFVKSQYNTYSVDTSKGAGLYRCQGESLSPNTKSNYSNWVYVPPICTTPRTKQFGDDKHNKLGSNQLFVGIAIGLLLGSTLTLFLLRIWGRCLPPSRALWFCRRSQAPSSDQFKAVDCIEEPQENGVVQHASENLPDEPTAAAPGDPKSIYVKLTHPTTTNDCVAPGDPKTIYVRLTHPTTTNDCDGPQPPHTVYAKLTQPEAANNSDGQGDPKTVYAKLTHPLNTNYCDEQRHPHTLYVTLTPPNTTDDCGDPAPLLSHTQVN